ncbi:unnamed protein product [Spirodela intermedia]|uniref:Uncharacterized protein n=1 Tax=Spirodela intermedia TaxID=51605 RepID=A0A7I8LL73_SPIIN|nr:unnamed protein product [Spirodela intermedia]
MPMLAAVPAMILMADSKKREICMSESNLHSCHCEV